ncbi:MAG TPA: hypothetical protein VJM46_00275 [Candidatus Saccharimonadales bacterium]|nr:hypothetical protein [Candidatus Saccharimonadales bacterium]
MPQEEDDALDKIVRDQDLELEEQDTSIPLPSEDGDADTDLDERLTAGDTGHDTN